MEALLVTHDAIDALTLADRVLVLDGGRVAQVGAPAEVAAEEAPAAEGWLPAAPADLLDRGPWWQLFGDAGLNELAERVEVSNQNIAVAVANYAQARSIVAQQRASLFPVVSLGAGGDRAGPGPDGGHLHRSARSVLGSRTESPR